MFYQTFNEKTQSLTVLIINVLSVNSSNRMGNLSHILY